MKVRSLVDKFTLKEKKKYIAKGRIYDVLHEEERGYAVIDVDGDDVILRHSECKVVEYDNPEEVDRVVNYEKVIEKILERQYEACKGIKCANCCVLDECCQVFGDITICDTLTKERFVKGIKEHWSLMCE